MIALMTLVVVGALILDRVVVTPVRDGLRQTESQKQQLLAQINEANSLFERRQLMERKWKTMLSDGLHNGPQVESRVSWALDEWSQDARLALTSVKPERTASDKGMNEVTFVVAGRGGLDAVAWFLYQIETSELPVKVKSLQLGSTSESGDNMSLQLRLSAIYVGAESKSAETPLQMRQPEANDEEQLL